MNIRLLMALVFFICVGTSPVLAKGVVASLSSQVGKKGPSFDGRDWFVGFSAVKGNNSITEYVLEGEKVQSWSELVTVQEMIGAQKMPINDFLAAQILMLKRKCPEIQYKPIRVDKSELMYEWQTSACQGENFNESEISRVKYMSDRVMIMHYASRQPISYAMRGKWISIIESAIFKTSEERKTKSKKNP